jgi:tetratricopeptide (TPR) repeat protein
MKKHPVSGEYLLVWAALGTLAISQPTRAQEPTQGLATTESPGPSLAASTIPTAPNTNGLTTGVGLSVVPLPDFRPGQTLTMGIDGRGLLPSQFEIVAQRQTGSVIPQPGHADVPAGKNQRLSPAAGLVRQAEVFDEKGDDFFQQSKIAEAEAAYEKARRIRKVIADNYDYDISAQTNLIHSYENLARISLAREDYRQARKHYTTMADIADGIVKTHPDYADGYGLRSACYKKVGDLSLKLREEPAALEAYEKAETKGPLDKKSANDRTEMLKSPASTQDLNALGDEKMRYGDAKGAAETYGRALQPIQKNIADYEKAIISANDNINTLQKTQAEDRIELKKRLKANSDPRAVQSITNELSAIENIIKDKEDAIHEHKSQLNTLAICEVIQYGKIADANIVAEDPYSALANYRIQRDKALILKNKPFNEATYKDNERRYWMSLIKVASIENSHAAWQAAVRQADDMKEPRNNALWDPTDNDTYIWTLAQLRASEVDG